MIPKEEFKIIQEAIKLILEPAECPPTTATSSLTMFRTAETLSFQSVPLARVFDIGTGLKHLIQEDKEKYFFRLNEEVTCSKATSKESFAANFFVNHIFPPSIKKELDICLKQIDESKPDFLTGFTEQLTTILTHIHKQLDEGFKKYYPTTYPMAGYFLTAVLTTYIYPSPLFSNEVKDCFKEVWLKLAPLDFGLSSVSSLESNPDSGSTCSESTISLPEESSETKKITTKYIQPSKRFLDKLKIFEERKQASSRKVPTLDSPPKLSSSPSSPEDISYPCTI